MIRLLAPLATLLLAALAPAQLTCTVTDCGTSCGPNLAVTYTPQLPGPNQRIDLVATGLHPDTFVVLMWGDAPVSFDLGAGCLLLQNMIWTEIHISSSAGDFSWGRTWPATVPGTFHMQMASVVFTPNFGLLTTNCKIGTCL